MSKYKILYIDDSSLNLETFQDEFADVYAISTCSDSMSCLTMMIESNPDLVILDVHMPRLSGVEVFNQMREHPQLKKLPVMFYSADDSDDTLVNGLALGAEDFLLRSMSPAHIRARIDARLSSYYKLNRKKLNFMNLSLKIEDNSVHIDKERVPLTLIEFKILDFLLKNRDSRVMKDELISAVWNKVHVQSRTLNTHLSNLRTKIKDAEFVIRINRNNQILLLPRKND